MKNYVPIDRVLLNIPKAVREQAEDIDLLAYALDAYNLLDIVDRYEEVLTVVEIKDNKVKIPEDAKEILQVSYLVNPDDKETPSCEITQEETPVNPYDSLSLSEMQQFVQSNLYQNRFIPLKFKGNASKICCNCPEFLGNCPQYFNIDMNKNIVTSFKTGTICIVYSRPIKDENGNYLIYDFPEVIQFLAYYAQLMHAQERVWRHEEGIYSLYDRLLDITDSWWKKAIGVIRLRNVDTSLIRSINFVDSPNQRLIRLAKPYMENTRMNR